MKLLLLSAHRDSERGSAVVEFMLSTLVWVPLLLGVIAVGTELIREIQVTQVCRDAAHMYAYGIDFTESANQSLILATAPNLGLTATGGNGLILLSTVEMVSSADCAAGGLDDQHCPNLNYAVFTQQIPIGNPGYRSNGAFNPTAGVPPTGSDGSVSQHDILYSSSDRANNIGPADSLLPLQAGQKAYIGEMFLANNDLAWTGLSAKMLTSRSIF